MYLTESAPFKERSPGPPDLDEVWLASGDQMFGNVIEADERGIPAGTPKGPVVHKVGVRTLGLNDAALVVNGPQGAYVLAICSTAPDSVAGWQIVARLANRVWQFEASRPA